MTARRLVIGPIVVWDAAVCAELAGLLRHVEVEARRDGRQLSEDALAKVDEVEQVAARVAARRCAGCFARNHTLACLGFAP